MESKERSAFKHEQKEREERKRQEVWLIEDDHLYASSLERAVSRGSRSLTAFGTAQAALAELEDRAKNKEALPNVILIDGNLLEDEGELRSGDKVVAAIRELYKKEKLGEPPFMVAVSNTQEKNEAMLECGADSILKKPFLLSELSSLLDEVREERLSEDKGN